tara:strand:- start:27 stop:575 length:549 start_codon:yes stop_codon:yes gene_type:complete
MKLEESSVKFTSEGANDERLTWIYDSYDELLQDVKEDYALDFFSERNKENSSMYGIGFDNLNNINKYYTELKIDNSHIIKAIRKIDGKFDYRLYIKQENKKHFKAYPTNSKFEKIDRAFAFHYTLTSDFRSKNIVQRMADKRNLDVSDFLENSHDKLLTWAMGSKYEMTIYYFDKEKALQWT